MCRRFGKRIGSLVVIGVVLWVVFTIAIRAKCSPVLTGIRKMNRAVMNPRQMGTAGKPGAYASIVRHVGRNSGTSYETPVQALPTEDGFVIPLPYGRTADWMKNVLAAGSAEIVNEGETWGIDQPEVVASEVALPFVPSKYQRTLRVYGVDEFLLVHRGDAVVVEE